MHKGYVQVYTGNGKGKTTAALGLALRAAGAGFKVFIAQFVKNKKACEHKALERFKDLIKIKQYGKGFILKRKPDKADIKAARKGIKELKALIHSGNYDVVILDEANVAVHRNLFHVEDLLELMASKPEKMEMIITGRYANKKIIKAADLVTEMREVKHYRKKGVTARRGIEK